jgi:hypothetical protein
MENKKPPYDVQVNYGTQERVQEKPDAILPILILSPSGSAAVLML